MLQTGEVELENGAKIQFNDPQVVTQEFILASIAISLKRIADALNEPDAYGLVGPASLANAITRGLRE